MKFAGRSPDALPIRKLLQRSRFSPSKEYFRKPQWLMGCRVIASLHRTDALVVKKFGGGRSRPSHPDIEDRRLHKQSGHRSPNVAWIVAAQPRVAFVPAQSNAAVVRRVKTKSGFRRNSSVEKGWNRTTPAHGAAGVSVPRHTDAACSAMVGEPRW